LRINEGCLAKSELRDLGDKISGRSLTAADALDYLGRISTRWALADDREPARSEQQPLHSESATQLFELLHPFLPVLRVARKKKGSGCFELNLEQIVEKPRWRQIGITALHIVGGLHPSLPFGYTSTCSRLEYAHSHLAAEMFPGLRSILSSIGDFHWREDSLTGRSGRAILRRKSAIDDKLRSRAKHSAEMRDRASSRRSMFEYSQRQRGWRPPTICNSVMPILSASRGFFDDLFQIQFEPS